MYWGGSMKSDKFFNATYSFMIGAGLITTGILMLIGRKSLYVNVVNLFIIAIFFLAIKQLINYFIGKEKDKKMNFIKSSINIVFCFVCSLFKNIPLSIIPLLFGFYLLLSSIINFINGGIYLYNKAKGYVTEFFLGAVYLIVSLSVIFSPIKNIDNVLIILGIYILLLGINYIVDFIGFTIPIHVKNRFRRHIRISLPALVEAVIPYTVLSEINYLIDKDSYDDFIFEEKKNDVEPDLEVFVHTSTRGFNRTGHVDLYYKNKVLSYGGYDDSSLRFFKMIGDGVVFTTSRDKYIPFCIEHSKKTIFAFGLKLTDRQKEEIDKAIENIFKDLVDWQSPYQEALNDAKKRNLKRKVKQNKYKDYASRLYQTTNAKFYKFTKGKWKKYFVVGNNCCKLADYIVGKSGIDLLKMYGVITPGAYYEYLNREFKKKNSMVISRKIYNSKNVDKKTIKEIFGGFSK